jgi:hypothetical protein
VTTRCRSPLASVGLTALCFFAVFWTGCASNSAPKEWLDPPRLNSDYAFGGWVEVSFVNAGVERWAAGELLAVSGDSLYMLPEGRLRTIARADVVAARLTGYRSDADLVGGWTAIMTASALSHGYGAVVSIPAWIILGTALTVSTSHGPVVHYSGAAKPGRSLGLGESRSRGGDQTSSEPQWAGLRLYARFPQGLPPALDRATLLPKPLAPSATEVESRIP